MGTCYLGDLYTSVHAPLGFWTWMIQVESIENDYILIQSLSVTSKCEISVERSMLDLET